MDGYDYTKILSQVTGIDESCINSMSQEQFSKLVSLVLVTMDELIEADINNLETTFGFLEL